MGSAESSKVCIKNIDASLEGFRWQFGKMSFPFVGDDGRASVRVKGLSITVEYDLRFEHGKQVVRKHVHMRRLYRTCC